MECPRGSDEFPHLGCLVIVRTTGPSQGPNDIQSCHCYFPPLVHGCWVPFDPDQMPHSDQYERRFRYSEIGCFAESSEW